jgi:hypothetical protein
LVVWAGAGVGLVTELKNASVRSKTYSLCYLAKDFLLGRFL